MPASSHVSFTEWDEAAAICADGDVMQLSHIGFTVVRGPGVAGLLLSIFRGIAIKPSYPYSSSLKLLVFNLNAGRL